MQNRFPNERPWQRSRTSDRNEFSSFVYLQVTLILPVKFGVIGLLVQEKKRKYIFKIAAMAAILDFRSE